MVFSFQGIHFFKYWFKLVGVFLCVSSVCEANIDLGGIKSGELLGSRSSYLVDESHNLSKSDLPPASDERWLRPEKEILSLGYTSVNVWLRLELENSSENETWFLEVAYPVLDSVDVYVRYAEHTDTYFLGDLLPFNVRPINHRNFVVPIILPSNETASVILKVKSGTSLQVPLKLWRQAEFHEHEQGSLMWQGIYFGFILVMVFYNLCLFYYSREKQYIYYACVFASFVCFQATLNGFTYQFIWSSLPRWNELALPIFLGSILISESLFVRSILDLKNKAPKTAVFLSTCAVLATVTTLASIFIPYRFSIIFLIILALPINLTGLIEGIKQWLEGNKIAQLFTIAWVGTLLGAIALALSKLGIIERNLITENALQLGSAISVLWLSFALGEYIAQQGRERQKSKEQALGYALAVAQERQGKLEAQESTLRMQRQANDMLESQVKERTNSLEKLMTELEQANSKLKHISHLDELTGLYNRRYFNQKLEAEFNRAIRLKYPISVLIIDIDYFKQVNDKYGHLVGDACIQAISETFKRNVTRPEDTLARFGGEEFIVILPGTSNNGAMNVANRLLTNVATSVIQFDDLTLRLTVSIGVAEFSPKEGDKPESLIALADTALYQAKSAGRNCIFDNSSSSA